MNTFLRCGHDRTCRLRIDTLTIEAEQQGDHRADTSSRPGKQLPHTMENSTDSKCEKEYKLLVKQCFEFCSSLEDKGCKFSFSLRQGRASISCCQVKDALQPHKEPGEGHPIFVVKISDGLPSWKGRRKSFLWQMRRQKQDTTTKSAGREEQIFWRTRRQLLPGRRFKRRTGQWTMTAH